MSDGVFKQILIQMDEILAISCLGLPVPDNMKVLG